MIEINGKGAYKIHWGKQNIEAVYKGEDLVWPPVYIEDRYAKFVFSQKGRPEDACQNVEDNDMIGYIAQNTKTYAAKTMEDGTVTVIPLATIVNPEKGYVDLVNSFDNDGNPKFDNTFGYTKDVYYDIDGKYVKSIYNTNSVMDFVVQIPKIYFLCKTLEEDVFEIKMSTYPFVGSHELFGKDRLIGKFSGEWKNNKWWSDINVSQPCTFSQAKQYVLNKGAGWYPMYTEEMGLLMMMDICLSGVNGNILTYGFSPFGISNIFCNGDGRMYPPNLVIDPKTNIATVYHLDGGIEQFNVPYIWGGFFNKLYWGEYLTILPKSEGTRDEFYRNSDSWIGNGKGIGIYTAEGEHTWRIAGDRDDSDATGVRIRCRACYYGKYHITTDVEYFESLPIL